MTALFTRTDYAKLPEGFPAQLVEGFLVKEPSPTYGHQRVQSRLLAKLYALLEADLVLAAPADVAIDDLNVFQPDIVVLRKPGRVDRSDVGIPLVAFEVVSPSTRRRDRVVKRQRLLGAGVREVWILDADRRAIERWDVDGLHSPGTGEALDSRAVAGFSVSADELFA